MRRALALCIALVSLGACADDTSSGNATGLADLCEAAATGADLDTQEAAFFDRAHDAIHDLARRATDADPGVTAQLLEAKQAVESEFVESAEEAIDPALFDRLIATTNAALAVVEEEPISC